MVTIAFILIDAMVRSGSLSAGTPESTSNPVMFSSSWSVLP